MDDAYNTSILEKILYTVIQFDSVSKLYICQKNVNIFEKQNNIDFMWNICWMENCVSLSLSRLSMTQRFIIKDYNDSLKNVNWLNRKITKRHRVVYKETCWQTRSCAQVYLCWKFYERPRHLKIIFAYTLPLTKPSHTFKLPKDRPPAYKVTTRCNPEPRDAIHWNVFDHSLIF